MSSDRDGIDWGRLTPREYEVQEPLTALAARVRLGDDGPEIVFVSIHLYRSAEQSLAQAQEPLLIPDA